jgi:VanZ family protein
METEIDAVPDARYFLTSADNFCNLEIALINGGFHLLNHPMYMILEPCTDEFADLFRLLFFSALITIFYLAVIPRHISVIPDLGDKFEHLGAFLVLAFLLDFSFHPTGFNVKKFSFLLGYGLLIEIVQSFLPFRDFSLGDLVADTLGICLYCLSFALRKRL